MKPILACFLLFFSTLSSAQEIALTFDDAPTPDGPLLPGNERTGRILTHLRQEKIDQVAFFVVTSNITKASRDRLVQYTQQGHLLANHTHVHQWIHRLGLDNYIRDIRRADSILRPMPGFVPWFRYPFLDEGRTISARDSIRNALNERGLVNGYITVDNYDWYINSLLRNAVAEKKTIDFDKLRVIYIDHIWNSVIFYDSIAAATLGRKIKHVLLLHENDLAAYFLGDLIRHFKHHGWKIISPAEAYRDPIASQVPDVLFNGQGRVAAIAREKGWTPRDLVQKSEDENYLTELLKRENVFR